MFKNINPILMGIKKKCNIEVSDLLDINFNN